MLFQEAKRELLKAQYADNELSFVELSRKLGEAWRALNVEEKAVYTNKADEAKEIYKLEIAAYESGKKKTPVGKVILDNAGEELNSSIEMDKDENVMEVTLN